MADYNRSKFSRGGSGGGFKKRDFNDRGSRGPAEMHQAVCDKCGKDCQVPFRPTQGKPVFCSNCFEKNPISSQRGEHQDWNNRRSDSTEREMFEAVCDNCGKDCKIPFRPTNGRPVYCSNCFDKGNNESRGTDSRNTSGPRNAEQPQYKEQLQELNAKLDKILGLLIPAAVALETPTESITEVAPKTEKRKKPSKKEALTQE